jgi:superfamily II DNA helicase RecQ
MAEWKIIKNYIDKYPNEKIIVYINNRLDTEKIADAINLNISNCCDAYHAGLSKINRQNIQNNFIEGRIKIIISTIAFGMGIDQVVKCILIFGCPSSIEEYYQQIGRGGRDGLPCETVLYYKDYSKKKFMIQKENNSLVPHKLENLYNVKDYFEINTCRRRFILEYFGMNKNYFLANSFTCNNCDNCKNKNLTDITEEVYDHLINNKPIIEEYKQELYKYNKLLNIFIHWKKIIKFNNYGLKDIPSSMIIKLPIPKIEIDLIDKYEKMI